MPNMTGRSLQRRLKKRSKTCPYKAGDSDELKRAYQSRWHCDGNGTLQLFNWLWTGEVMPTAWSQGHSEPFKAGDTQQPGNYRGITLVSICRKMFTNILRKRLKRRWWHEAQAAFRSKRSCADQQFVLVDRRLVRLERRCTRSFDLRKAYDTVWRDGLFYKLLKKGVDGKLWRVLRDMFAKTSSRVQ
jgi:hypothetical protein